MYGKNIHRFHPRFEADLGAIMTVGSITAQWQTVNARDLLTVTLRQRYLFTRLFCFTSIRR